MLNKIQHNGYTYFNATAFMREHNKNAEKKRLMGNYRATKSCIELEGQLKRDGIIGAYSDKGTTWMHEVLFVDFVCTFPAKTKCETLKQLL